MKTALYAPQVTDGRRGVGDHARHKRGVRRGGHRQAHVLVAQGRGLQAKVKGPQEDNSDTGNQVGA